MFKKNTLVYFYNGEEMKTDMIFIKEHVSPGKIAAEQRATRASPAIAQV